MSINELVNQLNSYRGDYTIQKFFIGGEIDVQFENDYIFGGIVKTSNKSGGESLSRGKTWAIIINKKKDFENLPNYKLLKAELLKSDSNLKVTPDRSATMTDGIRLYGMSDNPTAEIIYAILEFIFDGESEENYTLTSAVYIPTMEGRKKVVYTTRYERDPNNRVECLRIHGVKCKVCGFDFYERYGEVGKGFIEVHHIKPLHSLEEEVLVNPETDLVPLCSNCHSMIHRRKNRIVTVEELQAMIAQI